MVGSVPLRSHLPELGHVSLSLRKAPGSGRDRRERRGLGTLGPCQQEDIPGLGDPGPATTLGHRQPLRTTDDWGF